MLGPDKAFQGPARSAISSQAALVLLPSCGPGAHLLGSEEILESVSSFQMTALDLLAA